MQKTNSISKNPAKIDLFQGCESYFLLKKNFAHSKSFSSRKNCQSQKVAQNAFLAKSSHTGSAAPLLFFHLSQRKMTR